MKTKNNITRIAAQVAISASLSLAGFASALAAVSSESEVSAAAGRLDNLNLSIERSLKYEAPIAKEDVLDIEYLNALERLEDLTGETEKQIRFEAPAVDIEAEVEQYETGLAESRLENLLATVEEAVAFRAPSVDPAAEANETEVAAAAERLEAMSVAVEKAIRFSATSFADAESNEISGVNFCDENTPEVSLYTFSL